jgi:UDP-galactopyranose mutase
VIVGAGFSGVCAALILRDRFDCEIKILEQGSEPGGMLRTLRTRDGLPYEYGPRVVSVFRGTPDIIPFVERFVGLEERQIYQGTRLLPDYPVIPFPVDLESVRALPCGRQIEREMNAIREAGLPPREANLRDYLESSVGPTLTELAFEGFNRKFWGRRLESMPAAWGKLRRLERLSEKGDYRLPSRSPHYYPSEGFNLLFERMLAGVDLRTRTHVAGVRPSARGVEVLTDAGAISADLVIACAPIDALLEYRFGPLEWRGYRIEAEVVRDGPEAGLGRAPDGVPFAWLYTPWPDTPVCRTTDFGVIHQGADRAGPAVILREIIDDAVPMYPVWWEDERFYKYLQEAARIPRLVPLGRLGLYKYVTMDSTLAMVQRLAEALEDYLEGGTEQRFEILRAIRGDWQN